ncbi:ferroptosis suppressor protein 1-like isoform X1 [Glandiceps talaboti]
MGSSSSSSPLPQDMHVVIIGGGFAGVKAALMLKGKCPFTLIDGRDGIHNCVAALRASVQPGFAEYTFIPYLQMFSIDNFKQGHVTSIDVQNKKVRVEDKEREQDIEYTHLIIATGSSVPYPGKLGLDVSIEDGIVSYERQCQEIRASSKIVIIGGGAVGVELAGEIKTEYKRKDVTIIHSTKTLVAPEFSDKVPKEAKKQLERLGVNLILGERVTGLDELPEHRSEDQFTVTTDKGTQVQADLVLRCTGYRVNTSPFTETLGDSMNKKGQMKVNEYFEVKGHENIYAIGDCCSMEETKMAFRAGLNAEHVVHNLFLEYEGTARKPYVPRGPVVIVSIGRNGGVFQLSSMVFGAFAAKMVKSKDMFAAKFFKDRGIKPPKIPSYKSNKSELKAMDS